MTLMEPVLVAGADGPVRLPDVFEGRRMLIVYHFMWNKGAPHHMQCEGCTHSQIAMNSAVRAYLAERDVQFAVFSSGPWNEIVAYRDFMGWTPPWYSTADSRDVLATRNGGDLRCYLRAGDQVFETYETMWRGIEAMLPHSAVARPHSVRPAGDVGGLTRRMAARPGPRSERSGTSPAAHLGYVRLASRGSQVSRPPTW